MTNFMEKKMTTEIACLLTDMNSEKKQRFIGVLGTDCFPARYYAGYYMFEDNAFYASESSPDNFFYELQDALNKAMEVRNKHSKEKEQYERKSE